MNLEIVSLTEVTVDGQPQGSVVDVLANANDDSIRAPLLDALVAREKDLNDQIAALKSGITDVLSKANAIAKSKDDDKKKLAQFTALLADANRPEVDRQKAELQKQIDALIAEKAQLDAP